MAFKRSTEVGANVLLVDVISWNFLWQQIVSCNIC